ncbi:MAG: hypothetical protein P8M77_00745 [Porticoccaceae bacterium]|nr:hypothetical protein [Porticoccaceae bacterium]
MSFILAACGGGSSSITPSIDDSGFSETGTERGTDTDDSQPQTQRNILLIIADDQGLDASA